MRDPLVWLPFESDDLGDVPGGLRYEVVRVGQDESLPDSVGEVAFLVLPYRLGPTDPGLFAPMRSLQVVQSLSAGVDHLREAVPSGARLCNGRGIHDTATSELALALILAAQNRLPEFGQARRAGRWRSHWRPGLADRHVLIVGYGQIGAAIERRLAPFEVAVTRVARSARDGVHPIGELPGLLPDADVVVLIVPGTPETAGLMDAAMLGRMRSGALLVNLARGPVVDTAALAAELESGRLRAAVDVTDPEPLPAGHRLWQAPNLVLTPHVGGASAAMWPRAHRLVREQLERFAAGRPLANVMTGTY